MNKNFIYFNKKSIFLLVLTILWMGLIFFFSSQPADDSAYLSSGVVKMLLGFLDGIFNGNPPQFITGIFFNGDHFIRKAGHFTEYFILGILVYSFIRSAVFKRVLGISLSVCLLYAVSDEIHQIFVPGRGPSPADVLLDFSAAVAGIVLFICMAKLSRRVVY